MDPLGPRTPRELQAPLNGRPLPVPPPLPTALSRSSSVSWPVSGPSANSSRSTTIGFRPWSISTKIPCLRPKLKIYSKHRGPNLLPTRVGCYEHPQRSSPRCTPTHPALHAAQWPCGRSNPTPGSTSLGLTAMSPSQLVLGPMLLPTPNEAAKGPTRPQLGRKKAKAKPQREGP